jgi:hypothetical protein
MYSAILKFEIPGLAGSPSLSAADRHELIRYITQALETWGGQRDPNDWLRGSLDDVKVIGLAPVVTKTRKGR